MTFSFPSATDSSSGVSVGPGQMALTVMPYRATSRAMVLPNPMIPALQAEYTASPVDPTLPASEEMLTMRPVWRSTIEGSTALVIRMGPRRLMSMSRSQRSSSVCRNGASRSHPALLTSASIGPRAATISSMQRLTSPASVMSSRNPAAPSMAPAAVDRATSHRCR